ncbi:HEAT repeat domain-containing protein [Aquisphaera insulae]|uniref:HEAT repeat domain-containing protein n=1 Tax=Aquisphaera insulae TaxID=2712864 RepID=UPI0013EBE2C3|nr:HEAT repeat domain-containing protein [Aquisphaera insulae]
MRLPRLRFPVRMLLLLVAMVTLGLLGWRVYRDGLETDWLLLRLRHGNLAARRAAAARARDAMGESVAQTLFGSLQASPPTPQAQAARQQGQRRQAEILLPALAEVAKDPDPSCRAEALHALAFLAALHAPKSQKPAIFHRVLEATHDPEVSVRTVAVSSLTNLVSWDEPAVVGAIRSALEDPAIAVRREAAWQLGILGMTVPTSQPEAASLLVPLVAGRDDPAVRIKAIEALCLFGKDGNRHPPETGPDVVPPLVAALRDPEVEVRRAAAMVLGHDERSPKGGRVSWWETRKESIIPALQRSLTDDDRTVREDAALALFVMGRREPILKERMQDAASNPDRRSIRPFEEGLEQWQAEQDPGQPAVPKDDAP